MKGNEWAWANRHWEDVEHFKSVQKKWRNAGFIFFLSFPLLICGILLLIKGELYDLSIKEIKNNPKVIELVGDNLKPELIVFGEIHYRDSGAEGRLNYTIKGSKGEARVYVYGVKVLDRWELKELWLVEEGKDQKFDLLENSKSNL
ncbi:cytochrome c oxidase assembly factor Coa1 family protein [Vibrio hepatarius]|uniref:cytochrome c oxidase assembly factor Coa1 family protein n=1 Tax=Vibrio hepatarius TaxID=171383 RepID=UPI001C379D79|nr:cytochrome c oxidase assembly factor Coa1 family protein [Vibrio hepatarius]